MTTQSAYLVTDPEIVAAYRAALLAERDYRNAICAEVMELHDDLRPFGRPRYIEGVAANAAFTVGEYRNHCLRDANGQEITEIGPWRWLPSKDRYGPRQGKVGQDGRNAVKRWNAGWPTDPANVLEKLTGLPSVHITGSHMYQPGTLLDGDNLWVTYGTRLDAYEEGEHPMAYPLTGCHEEKLSAYYLARERKAAAQEVGA